MRAVFIYQGYYSLVHKFHDLPATATDLSRSFSIRLFTKTTIPHFTWKVNLISNFLGYELRTDTNREGGKPSSFRVSSQV